MKKFLVILLFIICCSQVFAEPRYGKTLPLPGKSLANVKLQGDTLMAVYSVASMKNNGCKEMNVVNTEVLLPPQDLKMENGSYVSGYWIERWDIGSCGKVIYIPVTFILDKTGATYSINPNSAEFAR